MLPSRWLVLGATGRRRTDAKGGDKAATVFSQSSSDLVSDATARTIDFSGRKSFWGARITANNMDGIWIRWCYGIRVSGNTITANAGGICVTRSSGISVSRNTLIRNHWGVWLSYSSDNRFHHNNFIANDQQVRIYTYGNGNVWDDGYPGGGNYWSDYTGFDEKNGPDQDQPGSDGIGDTPYTIDPDNQDRYPLMTMPGDVDGDRDVDIFDIVRIAIGYGTEPPDPRYDPTCDLDGDGDIDIFDIVIACANYGESW